MAQHHVTTRDEASETVVHRRDGDTGTHRELHQWRCFDVGCGVDERRQRRDAVRRRDHLARHCIGGHVADIAVAIQLHPREPVGGIEHLHGLTVQRLGIEGFGSTRAPTDGHQRAHDLAGHTCHIAWSGNPATQTLVGKIGTRCVEAWIERGGGHDVARGRRRWCGGVGQRNMSSAAGRMRAAAGLSGAVHVRPRTSAAGVASAASPMINTAAEATLSAKAVSVTSRARPFMSG